jgi:hypothetical protein
VTGLPHTCRFTHKRCPTLASQRGADDEGAGKEEGASRDGCKQGGASRDGCKEERGSRDGEEAAAVATALL